MAQEFKATHRITLTSPHGGATRSFVVMLCPGRDGAGAAYTAHEWRNDASADWERQPDGTWTFQGNAGPGNGWTVDVFSIEPVAQEGYDECTECGGRFNATSRDKRPICPKCR